MMKNASSKTGEPPFDINSISMDLNSASEKHTVKKCDHFTICGYIAEVRKKDWKRTFPFPIANYNSTSEEEQPIRLPPLRVPESRRWNCQTCLQEIGVKPSDADVGAALISKNSGCESKGMNTSLSFVGGSATSSGSHQPPKPTTLERIEIDLNKSITVDSSKNLSSSSDESDNGAKTTETTIKGHKNRLRHNDREIPVLTSSVAMEVDSGMIQEAQKVETSSNTVPVKSNYNRDVVLDKAGNGSHEAVHIDLLDNTPGSMVNNSAGHDQTEKQAPEDNEDMELTPAQRTSVLDEIHAEGHVKGYGIRKPCLEIDDSEDEVFETGVVLSRIGDQDNRVTSSNNSQRRRPRKIRLLIDLLGENGDPKAKHIPLEDLPINHPQNALSAVPVVPDIEQGNVRSSKGQSRKRKSSQDGEWKVPQPRFQNNAVNQIRGVVEMAETNGSKSKDASVLSGTSNGTKRHHTDLTHKSPILDKNKKRKMQVQDGYPNVQNEHENIKEKSIVGNVEDAFSGQEAYPSKRNVVLYDKGKTYKDVDELVRIVSPHDGRLIKEPNVIRYVDSSKTGDQAVPLQARDYPAAERGLGFSLNIYPGGHSFIRKHHLQVEEGQTSVSRQEDSYAESQAKGKDVTKYVMHPCVSSMSAQDSLLRRRRAPLDLNSKEIPYRIPNLNDRQTFEDEHALPFLAQSSDFLTTTNNEKHMESQERLASSRKYGDHGGKKISEQGIIDGVPMDIVELMAKNQFERHFGNNVNNIDTQKQAHAPHWSYDTVSQCLDWPSNGVQYSASSSSRPNSNQNVKWNADIVGQRSKHANMQAIGVCKTHPLPQRRQEAASHWPSRTPNHLPLKCNIPQKCTTRPTNMDAPAHYHWQKGNSFLNLNAPILESCAKNFPAENYGRSRTEHTQPSKQNRIDLNQSPMGPLDLNSKETISAMQLLSLMDAGMRSGPSFNLGAMPKFSNRTSGPQSGCSREFSSPQIVINKISSTVMLPQSNFLGMHCHSERSNGYFQSVPKVTGSSNSAMLPSPSGSKTLGSGSSSCSSKRFTESEICTVNKNPADFMVPGRDNKYMIRPHDLNSGDAIPPESRSRHLDSSHSGGRGRGKNKNP